MVNGYIAQALSPHHPLLAHAHALTVNSVFGGIAGIRRIIDADHAALAYNPGRTGTRLLDFAYRFPCHTYSRAISAFFGGVTLVGGVVYALHSSWALNCTGPGAGLFRR
jgi:hypothetical protein